MMQLPLTQGKFALVDDDLYPLLSQWRWCASDHSGKDYAMRSVGTRKSHKTIYLHRLIMELPEGRQIDHINGDTLDNRRENLRLATCAQNLYNRSFQSNNRVGYKGVTLDRRNGRFRTHIVVDRRQHFLGSFATAEEAARAYNEAALQLHGEFAYLNSL